jgi:hypothetical protein
MKILGEAPIRLAAASLVGAALVVAAPVAALATPTTPSKASPTTTTTTKAGKNAQAIAKLVIKASSAGHVNVETAGTSTFKPAKNGQSLHVGDTVQTDATGQAEIDYADTAYTRLDVNTTFTIKKLTDSQGNRQVEGSLDVGRTYNRTAALTQSQTFQQDAGGATAAVAGTAFVVTCTSATSCTFTAVIDNINLTGTGGGTKTLNPLDQCDANNGALCATTAHLTPDELALIEWIQQNVYLDLAEHGIGDGVFQPFAGTVVVNNGVVQSFSPSTPNQGFTPTTSPPSPTSPSALEINQSAPINVFGSSANPLPGGPQPANQFSREDEFPFEYFTVNATDPNNPANPQQNVNVEFPQLPTFGILCAPSTFSGLGLNCVGTAAVDPLSGYGQIMSTTAQFPATTQFAYADQQENETLSSTQTDTFQVRAVSSAPTNPPPVSAPATVTVHLVENPNGCPSEGTPSTTPCVN